MDDDTLTVRLNGGRELTLLDGKWVVRKGDECVFRVSVTQVTLKVRTCRFFGPGGILCLLSGIALIALFCQVPSFLFGFVTELLVVGLFLEGLSLWMFSKVGMCALLMTPDGATKAKVFYLSEEALPALHRLMARANTSDNT